MSSDTPDQPQPMSRGPGAEPEPPAEDALRSQHLDVDTLSAYLDRQLPPADMAAIGAHLATCPECGRDLAELRATVALLRGLPTYAPRRGFQLGPEYARGGGRGNVLAGWLQRLLPALPALRVATAAVAVLLVAVIAGDLVTNRGSEPVPMMQTGGGAVEDDAGDAGADRVEPVNAPESMPAPAMEAPAAERAMPRSAAVEATGAPAGAAPADDGTEPEAPASMEEEDSLEDAPGVLSPEPEAEPAPPSPLSGWRLAQVGLGLVLVWLIVILAGVSWLRRDRS